MINGISILLLMVALSGCSFRATYPAIGAGLGGGVAAIGGPAMAAGGAVLGGAIGTAIMEQGVHGEMEEKIYEVKQTVKALTQGDVETLIKQRADAERTGFEKVIDGIYQLMILAAVIAGLWALIPLLYRFRRKYLDKKIEKLTKDTK